MTYKLTSNLQQMDCANFIKELQSFIISKQELYNCMNNINGTLAETYQKCLNSTNNPEDTISRVLEIESILDFIHDELNTGHWSEVPVQIRQAFTAASYIKSLILLKEAKTMDHLRECLKCLDMGLLLGAPLIENPTLLTNSASYITTQLNLLNKEPKFVNNFKKRKCETTYLFESLAGIEIQTLNCPSLETFNKNHFSVQKPVKLKDCISHWPAFNKWFDLNYLVKTAGDRIVPIEIGSHYTDDNWQQKLMPLKDFLKQYFLEKSQNIGYLAQHNLFDQIPELKNDIRIPEYCCLSEIEEDAEPDINAWLGPGGTVSPLHYDPKHNLLAQIFGTKQLILYAPSDTEFLYPHDTTLLCNTAQVDPTSPNLQKYPNFNRANLYKCLLEPGEMLYIPPKWWHHVTALDKSFSVSFWWK